MSDALLPIATDPVSIERAADPGEFVVLACERAKQWLAQAIEQGEIDQLIEVKSQAEAIRVYTAQKQIGHDAELAAAEVVRRAERGIGLAIRRGQEAGEILTSRDFNVTANQHGTSGPRYDVTKGSPTEYFGNTAERRDSYVMADEASDDEFDEVITEAKDEGNLSRANVVRKIKGEAAPSANGTDKTRAGVRARERKLVDMAVDGHSSHQIADALGITRDGVRGIAERLGIEIPADRLVRRTRLIDPNRVIEETVLGIDGHTSALSLLNGRWSDVDLERVDEWVSSLSRSLTSLRGLHKQLKELTHG